MTKKTVGRLGQGVHACIAGVPYGGPWGCGGNVIAWGKTGYYWGDAKGHKWAGKKDRKWAKKRRRK